MNSTPERVVRDEDITGFKTLDRMSFERVLELAPDRCMVIATTHLHEFMSLLIEEN